MRIEIILVTPELAAEWLQSNTNNRNVKRWTVEQYARDMSAGRWAMTGDPIRFAPDGRLLDGQHRLMAVVKSQVAVEMVVIRGLDPSSQIVMDIGPSRTGGDALKLTGHRSVNQLASVAKLATHWIRGEIKVSHVSLKPLSTAEIAAAVEADPTLDVATAVGNRYTHKKGSGAGIRAAGSAISFAYWLIAGAAGSEAALGFLDDLSEHRTAGNGDPRLAAIQRLDSARERGESLRNMTQAFILITAWNAVRSGKSLTIIKLSANGKPLAFPEPLP